MNVLLHYFVAITIAPAIFTLFVFTQSDTITKYDFGIAILLLVLSDMALSLRGLSEKKENKE